MQSDTPSLLSFPCQHLLKVVGNTAPDFEARVARLVREKLTTLEGFNIYSRPSKEGRYQAISVTFRAESQAQLDEIYNSISQTAGIHFVL